MRILGAVFSKFFGGKFAIVKQILFTKNDACVLKEPVFSSKFFGGKI